MGDFLKYKSFLSSVEYSVDDNCLFGKVMFIKSLLTYEGETLQELEKIFHQTIDNYLADCQAEGIKPNVPCSGDFAERNPERFKPSSPGVIHEPQRPQSYQD